MRLRSWACACAVVHPRKSFSMAKFKVGFHDTRKVEGGIISFNQASLQIGQFKIKIRSNPTFLNPFPLCPLFFNLVFQPPSFTNLPSSYWCIAFSYVGGIVCAWHVHKVRLLCTLSASPIVHSLNACVYTDDNKYHITNLMSVVHMTHN